MSNWVFDSPFGGVSADNEGDFFIYKPLTKTTLSSSIPKETHINNNNIQPIKAWKFHNSSKSIEAQVLIEVSKNSSSRKNSLPPHKSIYLSYTTISLIYQYPFWCGRNQYLLPQISPFLNQNLSFTKNLEQYLSLHFSNSRKLGLIAVVAYMTRKRIISI